MIPYYHIGRAPHAQTAYHTTLLKCIYYYIYIYILIILSFHFIILRLEMPRGHLEKKVNSHEKKIGVV